MKNLLYLFTLICACFIFSCTDNSEPLKDTDLEKQQVKLEKRSPYDCLPSSGPCSQSGTSIDLSQAGPNSGLYDLSDCITPTPTSLCSVTGYMDVYWCDEQILMLEPQDIELPDCGASASYIDWDCVRETIAAQLEPWLWEYNLQSSNLWPACHFGDEIYTTTLFKNTCWTSCTTMDPWPQSRLVECGDGDACCYKINYWCDEGDGLEVYETEIGSFGDCGEPQLISKSCILEGPCRARDCFTK